MSVVEEEEVMIPPLNFEMVSRGIYRSGYPNKRNFPFLNKLGLRSIVYLCEESYQQPNLDFVRASNIQLFCFPTQGNKEPFLCISSDLVTEALRKIMDKKNHPVLIHCSLGNHRTGCIVGCLRKIEGFSLSYIFEEYKRFTAAKSRLLDRQFIENFHYDQLCYP